MRSDLTRLMVAGRLTGRQGRVTGDADSSLLPVHVDQLTLQAAAGGAEHLQHTEIYNSRLASRQNEKSQYGHSH